MHAKALLTDVNITFTDFATTPHCHDGKNSWRLLFADESVPPQCLCDEYRNAPCWSPRSMDKRRGYWNCRHTLAWLSYATVLNGHWRNLRAHAPMAIAQYEHWTGTQHKLGDHLSLVEFSRWLQRQPAPLLLSSRAIGESENKSWNLQSTRPL